MTHRLDILILNAAQVLTMRPDMGMDDTGDPEGAEIGVIRDGGVAIENGKIRDVGSSHLLAASYTADRIIDATGAIVTPGLVDPHTHLVFAGSRHVEFGMRMRGASYHQILAAGGGIHATVQATRAASLDALVATALPRLKRALGFGVTTVEVKSGYGLDVDTELKMLRVLEQLSTLQPVRIMPTYLGAHVVPLEHRKQRTRYVDMMVQEMIPEISQEGLATACDVFLDEGAFTRDEAVRILGTARDSGLDVKIHAGQFTDQGGPQLVAELNGLSADHLELISDAGIADMAAAGVVANLLPGAAFCLRDGFPDGRRMIDGGVRVAVATDNNPGTSRTENLPLMAAMGVTRMGLTCAEAWQAMTVNAAKAVGQERCLGAIAPGMTADLSIFLVEDFRIPLYHFGTNWVGAVLSAGKLVVEEPINE
ncbi:MAG: imidazolonepropionase [Myxococcota bacterium]|nr:imidazolonepropionase [Myxococcota bacterium]